MNESLREALEAVISQKLNSLSSRLERGEVIKAIEVDQIKLEILRQIRSTLEIKDHPDSKQP